MNVLEALKALDALFDSEERWTKGANARDENGGACNPFDERAVCMARRTDLVMQDDVLLHTFSLVPQTHETRLAITLLTKEPSS
jgi:hypothetical protein